MPKDVKITYTLPKVDRTLVPGIYQYCSNCKDSTVHKRLDSRQLICNECKKTFRHS